jgi:hypothetical protein
MAALIIAAATPARYQFAHVLLVTLLLQGPLQHGTEHQVVLLMLDS